MKGKFPYRYRVLIFIFFLTLISYLDRTCISLVGVRIKSEFHLSNEQFGWVLGAFALAYALFEIPSAVLGDRIGQRAVLIRIVLWWSLFTALTGVTSGNDKQHVTFEEGLRQQELTSENLLIFSQMVKGTDLADESSFNILQINLLKV